MCSGNTFYLSPILLLRTHLTLCSLSLSMYGSHDFVVCFSYKVTLLSVQLTKFTLISSFVSTIPRTIPMSSEESFVDSVELHSVDLFASSICTGSHIAKFAEIIVVLCTSTLHDSFLSLPTVMVADILATAVPV